MPSTKIVNRERTDLLEALAKRRHFLRFTVRDLSDTQAAERPTASELCLGGLIKHVADTERGWIDFIQRGRAAMASSGEDWDVSDWTAPAATDEFVRSLPDLDAAQPLPQAPWFEPGAEWSARTVLLHIIAETSQHAGHADILRESIDGAKTMG